MESPWPDGLRTDRFIRTGDTDIRAALAGTYFGIWRTEEVRAMLQWMRDRNARHADEPPLSFAGFDMQLTEAAVQIVLDSARCLDSQDRDALAQLYDGIGKLDEGSGTVSNAERLQLKNRAAKALELVQARFAASPDVRTAQDRRDAIQAARVVLQACEMHAASGFEAHAARDRAMAENVRWLLEERYPGEKIVLWCHNGHVGTSPIVGTNSQGMHLRARYGTDMVVLGFASHRGTLRARRYRTDAPLGPQEVLPIPAALPGSVEAVFNEAALPRFVLDFRGIPAESALAQWLGSAKPHRSIGAAFNPDGVGYSPNVLLPAKYDGIIFIAEGSATKPVQALPAEGQSSAAAQRRSTE